MLRNNRFLPYLLIAPFLLLFALPLALSIFSMLKQSFSSMNGMELDGLTLKHYADVLKSGLFYSSLGYSTALAAVASFVSVCLGFAGAFLLAEDREDGITMNILRLPILIPHFTAAFMVFLLLSQSGLASRIMESLGLLSDIEEFPKLIFDPYGLGIIISYMWKEVPFCILFILPTLKLVGKGLGEAAYTLGAGRGQYMLQVALPSCRTSVVSLFIILLAYNFGSFEVPFLLGASYPKALGVLGYISYVSPDPGSRPYTMALNIIIAVMSGVLVLAYSRLVKKIKLLEGQL